MNETEAIDLTDLRTAARIADLRAMLREAEVALLQGNTRDANRTLLAATDELIDIVSDDLA